MKRILATVGLLICSNTFMNTAWYGHLKFKSSPIVLAILVSWGIALFEYCFQVPANRIGNDVLTVTQLKVIQEIISLSTFAMFAFVVFKQKPNLNQLAAFILIVIAAYLIVKQPASPVPRNLSQ